MNEQLKLWNKFVTTQNVAFLDEILADDVTFHSPFVWQPKEGKLITMAILTTVVEVFEEFKYIRGIVDEANCMLEFEAKIDDLKIRGVDIIKFGEDGKFVDFEVMVRPANGLKLLGIKMTEKLSEKGLI